MIQSILHRLLVILQLPFVLLFIIFEEVIWEGIAEPLYQKFKSLRLLVKVEQSLMVMPTWSILSLFVVIFIIVEVAGIVAGVLFVQGEVLIGLLLYIVKIPVAAFAFWMFRVTKERLLTYGWFAWIYERLVGLFQRIKAMPLYQSTMERARVLKGYLKGHFVAFKLRYFSQESLFVTKFKTLYRAMKRIFNQA